MEVKCVCGGTFEEAGHSFECDSCDNTITPGIHAMKLKILANRENEKRMEEDRKKANVGVKRSYRLGKR